MLYIFFTYKLIIYRHGHRSFIPSPLTSVRIPRRSESIRLLCETRTVSSGCRSPFKCICVARKFGKRFPLHASCLQHMLIPNTLVLPLICFRLAASWSPTTPSAPWSKRPLRSSVFGTDLGPPLTRILAMQVVRIEWEMDSAWSISPERRGLQHSSAPAVRSRLSPHWWCNTGSMQVGCEPSVIEKGRSRKSGRGAEIRVDRWNSAFCGWYQPRKACCRSSQTRGISWGNLLRSGNLIRSEWGMRRGAEMRVNGENFALNE